MAEATSNRIIFLPASKSNVTRMQRKKKKKKFITRVDVLTFPVKLTLKREYSFRRALDFIQRDRKIFIGKLSFSFLPIYEQAIGSLFETGRPVLLEWSFGIQNWILQTSQKIWNSWFSFFSEN